MWSLHVTCQWGLLNTRSFPFWETATISSSLLLRRVWIQNGIAVGSLTFSLVFCTRRDPCVLMSCVEYSHHWTTIQSLQPIGLMKRYEECGCVLFRYQMGLSLLMPHPAVLHQCDRPHAGYFVVEETCGLHILGQDMMAPISAPWTILDQFGRCPRHGHILIHAAQIATPRALSPCPHFGGSQPFEIGPIERHRRVGG